MLRKFSRALIFCASVSIGAGAQAGTTSIGEVYEIIDPGSSASSVGDRVDATTMLFRNDDGMGMTFNTRDLRRNAPFTTWWVVFNEPQNCQDPCACNFPDVFDPAQADAAQTSVFWASGRVTDKFGQGVFHAQARFNELPDGEDQVLFGPGLVNPDAEVHLVTRTHGRLKHRRGKREAQLTEFNGACAPDCFDTQVSVHRSPSCQIP
ncbi:MAG: hypothetical protein K0U93_08925 [Gammaproteobacteria bacterium]|nr:hypothetical protein [Gammaproteobacteria bacterium]